FLLLRGHHHPGGGFAAALVAASGLLLHGLTHGTAAARRLLGWHPFTIIAAGLATIAGCALLGPLRGQALLSAWWWHADIGSPLLFDGGVFLVVIGVVTTCAWYLDEAEEPWQR
ncbi:MAG: MnhB domain-containing protein, partial [Planctomycetota bacterium]